MHSTGERINKTGLISSVFLYRRSPNVSSIILRYRFLSNRNQTFVLAHHPQESILSKAAIAFTGLAINTLEFPYLLVFLPRVDVLVQSAMVFNTIKGLAIPCRRMLSFALAIAYGCLYTFHTKLSEIWLRFNIVLIIIFALLSGGKYVKASLGMLIIAVQLYRSYLDTEAIWATIVISFYLIRLEREYQPEHNSTSGTYSIIPQAAVDDTIA